MRQVRVGYKKWESSSVCIFISKRTHHIVDEDLHFRWTFLQINMFVTRWFVHKKMHQVLGSQPQSHQSDVIFTDTLHAKLSRKHQNGLFCHSNSNATAIATAA